jgi:hypothetical protein
MHEFPYVQKHQATDPVGQVGCLLIISKIFRREKARSVTFDRTVPMQPRYRQASHHAKKRFKI